MKAPSRTVAALLLALAGAGIGANMAQEQGVSSWLDAKLYLAIGAAVGIALAGLLSRVASNRE